MPMTRIRSYTTRVQYRPWESVTRYAGVQTYKRSHSFGPIFYTPGRDSTIIDDPTRLEDGGELLKPCLHVKSEMKWFPPVLEWPLDNGWSNYNFAIIGASDGGIPSWTPKTLSQVGEQKQDAALSKLLPSVNEGISLVNFVLELKDLRRMLHVWSRKKNVIANAADAHLNASFGWIPLINDLKGIYQGLRKAQRKIRWLRENAKKRLTSHLRWTIEKSVVSNTTTSSHGWDYTGSPRVYPFYPQSKYQTLVSGNGDWRTDVRTVDTVESTYHATLLYRYTLPAATELEDKWNGFLDALGVRLDPAIVWNAIPFSFMVDWVADVSGYLRSFSGNNMGIKTEIVDFQHSVKSTATRDRYLEVYENTPAGRQVLHPWVHFQQDTRERYERARGRPRLHAVTGSALDLREVGLTAALIASKVKAQRRRKAYPGSWKSRGIVVSDPW